MTFAKMLKALAKAIHDQHDGQIPANYDNLLCLLGIEDWAVIFYLNYSAERSEVSLLLVCEKFSSTILDSSKIPVAYLLVLKFHEILCREEPLITTLNHGDFGGSWWASPVTNITITT